MYIYIYHRPKSTVSICWVLSACFSPCFIPLSMIPIHKLKVFGTDGTDLEWDS